MVGGCVCNVFGVVLNAYTRCCSWKSKLFQKTKLGHTAIEVSSAKGKEGPDFEKNTVFEIWVASGGSGTPPLHSNVFVGVFGMRLEFTPAPAMTSAAEFPRTNSKNQWSQVSVKVWLCMLPATVQ